MTQLRDLISPAELERCGKREFPVLSMTMHDGIMLQSERFKKSLASVDQSGYKVVRRNQLVVGFPIDEGVLYIQKVADAGIMSPAYDVWNVDQNAVDLDYLELCLHSPQSMLYYKSNLRGTTARRRSLPKDVLLSLPVSLPDRAEQRKIASIIHQIKSVIEIQRHQLKRFDQLIKARFVEMFGVFPENPKGWKTGTIRDVVSDVRYGSSRPAVEGGRYPYLRMNNITYGGELDLTDTKRIDVPESELEKCTVRRGDVLFNRTNSKELVGKTCVYNRDEMMVLAGFVIRVRLNEQMLPEFLSAFLNTDFSKAMLLGMCKAAIGQANINAQEMQGIRIYIPPIDRQKEFVLFKAQVDKSKVVEQAALDKAQLLFDSLMQQYFG